MVRSTYTFSKSYTVHTAFVTLQQFNLAVLLSRSVALSEKLDKASPRPERAENFSELI